MLHGPIPKSSQNACIRGSSSRTTNATWAILPILKMGPSATGRLACHGQRGCTFGQTRQHTLAEFQDVDADDLLSVVRLARLQSGQDRPVPLGDLLERQVGGPQSAD